MDKIPSMCVLFISFGFLCSNSDPPKRQNNDPPFNTYNESGRFSFFLSDELMLSILCFDFPEISFNICFLKEMERLLGLVRLDVMKWFKTMEMRLTKR